MAVKPQQSALLANLLQSVQLLQSAVLLQRKQQQLASATLQSVALLQRKQQQPASAMAVKPQQSALLANHLFE
jgi:hypothetical protein